MYRSTNIHQDSIDPRTKMAPDFTADNLYFEMVNPSITSKGMITYKKDNHNNAQNRFANPSLCQLLCYCFLFVFRFQNIWIWNGRPQWDEIFEV